MREHGRSEIRIRCPNRSPRTVAAGRVLHRLQKSEPFGNQRKELQLRVGLFGESYNRWAVDGACKRASQDASGGARWQRSEELSTESRPDLMDPLLLFRSIVSHPAWYVLASRNDVLSEEKASRQAGHWVTRYPQDRYRRRTSDRIGIETLQAEDFVQQVPIEGLQMSDIKDDAMALRNGALVKGTGADDTKEFITK